MLTRSGVYGAFPVFAARYGNFLGPQSTSSTSIVPALLPWSGSAKLWTQLCSELACCTRLHCHSLPWSSASVQIDGNHQLLRTCLACTVPASSQGYLARLGGATYSRWVVSNCLRPLAGSWDWTRDEHVCPYYEDREVSGWQSANFGESRRELFARFSFCYVFRLVSWLGTFGVTHYWNCFHGSQSSLTLYHHMR